MLVARHESSVRYRTMHAGYVIVMLFIMGVMLLGAYEAFASLINPAASIRAHVQTTPDAVSAPTSVAPAPRWVSITGPVQTYWLDDREAWVAMPGERFRLLKSENDWLLVRSENDPPERVIWIERHPWVVVDGE